MKTLSCWIAVAVASLTPFSPGFAQDFSTEENLRAVLQKRLEAEVLPVCAIAGFAGEKTVVARACTEGASAPTLTADAFVEIGSISKALTGLVLADMVERGEVGLDDTAASIAPKDARLPRKDDRDIRLRDLVSQSSGLPRMPPGFSPKDATDPYSDFGVEALYEALARTELARAPGSGYEYSNFGFLWLSELLGRRSGRDFESLVKERLFGPLGMKESAVRLSPGAMKRLAQGHDPARRPVRAWDFVPALAGVGGIRATTDEMMRLAEALAGRRASPLEAAIRRSQEALFANARGGGVGYAWNIVPRPGGKLFWHNGGTAGFHTMLAFSPTARRAAFVVADSPASFEDLALFLVDPSMPLKAKRIAIALEEALLDEYVGRYELRPGFVLAVRREGGRLVTQATGQGPIEVFAEAKDRLFARAIDAQLVFRRGADGRVDAFTLVQGGRESLARKLP
ncbi:MAG: serine hydrolase [Betaproteobacteria bacterium]|nr:serine hydrolase [Betaproteobacteria bacterium]